MKEKLHNFFRGKKVVILGFGREGRSTLELIKDFDCEIAIADINLQIDSSIEQYQLINGVDYLKNLNDFDIIMKTPGVVLKNKVSSEVKEKITSQTDLLLRFCENTIIGISGTKGKSTVSSLIYHLLVNNNCDAQLIGNIGIPPLQNIRQFNEKTIIVCEMSCHQLEYVRASPDIAVLLNIYPEHLDHYASFDDYQIAKEKIYMHQKTDDILITNIECIGDKMNMKNMRKITASYGVPCDIFADSHQLKVMENYIPLSDIHTSLKGAHNLFNIGIALAAAELTGVSVEKSLSVLDGFKGLEHRLESFANINGVEFINDSISTIPQTAIAALKAFDGVDTILIGGMDRGISYENLAEYIDNRSEVKNIIALPDSGYKMSELIKNPNITVSKAEDMAAAVQIAKKVSEKRCILSPAAASYGFYKNFEERGSHFKQLVLDNK